MWQTHNIQNMKTHPTKTLDMCLSKNQLMVWWHILSHVALGEYVINDMQLTCDSPPETLGAGGFVDPEVIFSGHSRSGDRVCWLYSRALISSSIFDNEKICSYFHIFEKPPSSLRAWLFYLWGPPGRIGGWCHPEEDSTWLCSETDL